MTEKKRNPLVGKFFHSIKDDRETIEWQGEILSEPRDGLFLLQLFDWFIGADAEQMLVPIEDMKYWNFYDTTDEMVRAYEKYCARREAREAIAASAVETV